LFCLFFLPAWNVIGMKPAQRGGKENLAPTSFTNFQGRSPPGTWRAWWSVILMSATGHLPLDARCCGFSRGAATVLKTTCPGEWGEGKGHKQFCAGSRRCCPFSGTSRVLSRRSARTRQSYLRKNNFVWKPAASVCGQKSALSRTVGIRQRLRGAQTLGELTDNINPPSIGEFPAASDYYAPRAAAGQTSLRRIARAHVSSCMPPFFSFDDPCIHHSATGRRLRRIQNITFS